MHAIDHHINDHDVETSCGAYLDSNDRVVTFSMEKVTCAECLKAIVERGDAARKQLARWKREGTLT